MNFQTIFDKKYIVLDILDKVDKKYDSVPAKVFLAWLLSQINLVALIVSATNKI